MAILDLVERVALLVLAFRARFRRHRRHRQHLLHPQVWPLVYGAPAGHGPINPDDGEQLDLPDPGVARPAPDRSHRSGR